MAKFLFDATELENFWCSTRHSYQKLSIKDLSVIVPLTTTYLCECGCSSTSYENKLRVTQSICVPRHERIISENQQQKFTGFVSNEQ